MKIGVSCRREHRFQGSRESEKHEISRLKSEEVKVSSREQLLAILVIFGCPLGSHGAPFFKKNALVSRSDFLMTFL